MGDSFVKADSDMLLTKNLQQRHEDGFTLRFGYSAEVLIFANKGHCSLNCGLCVMDQIERDFNTEQAFNALESGIHDGGFRC